MDKRISVLLPVLENNRPSVFEMDSFIENSLENSHLTLTRKFAERCV